MSASTLAKRKLEAKKRAVLRAAKQAKHDYLDAVYEYEKLTHPHRKNKRKAGRGKTRLPPDIQRMKPKRVKRYPVGVVHDPFTGQFVSSADVVATPEYRAESARVKRLKIKRRGAAATSRRRHEEWLLRTFRHKPSF